MPACLACILVALFGALTARRAADWTSDRRLWASCFELYPDSPRVNYNLGRRYHMRLAGCSSAERRSAGADAALSRAEFHFKKALDAEPRYAKALAGLAHVELDRGNSAGALERLSRAVACEPDDAVLRADYGVVLENLGIRQAAVKELEFAASLAPNDPDILGYLGAAYLDLGRFPEAIRPLEKAVSLAPTEARLAFNLSYAYKQVGEMEKARELDEGLVRSGIKR